MRMVFRAATAATVILIVRATYGFGAPESEAKQAQPEATRLRTDALRARPVVAAVSAQDRAELVGIFKGVDPSLYRLQFDGGRETYGDAKISMQDIRQMHRFVSPLDERGWIVLIVENKSNDVIYIVAASGKDLESVLGTQKIEQLRALAAKYGPTVNPSLKSQLVEIFRDVDPSLYRLQFDGGRETFGTAKISMRDIRQTTRFTNPLDEHGWIVFVVETKSQDVIYVLAASGKDLTSVLGAQKVSQLKTLSTQFEALGQ